MKNELEKNLKRFLKGKLKITLATVVAFAISGNMVLGATLEERIANLEKLISSGTGTESIKIGTKATASGDASTAMGMKSLALGSGSLAAGGYNGVNSLKGGRALSLGSIALGAETVAGQKIIVDDKGTPEPEDDEIKEGEQEAVAIGYRAKAIENKTMALGFDAEATVEGGFALGSNAKANIAKGIAGYDISKKANSTDTSAVWKSTMGALAIGDVKNNHTRQITGLAAGTKDTDAVNVAQLKKAVDAFGSGGGSTVDLSGYYKKSETYNQTEVNKKIDDLAKATTTDIDVVAWKKKLGVGSGGSTVDLTDYAKTKDIDGKLNKKVNTKDFDIYKTETAKKLDTKVDKDAKNLDKDDVKAWQEKLGVGVGGADLTAYAKKAEVDKKIRTNSKEIKSVGAMSAALAGLHPMGYKPNQKTQVMASVGMYKDSQAVAVGLSHHTSENFMLSAGVTAGTGYKTNAMGNVGFTWRIGKDDGATENLTVNQKLEVQNNVIKSQAEEIKVLSNLVWRSYKLLV